MLLTNKNAVIYGGGGAIGSAVAKAFARQGARVHLAGRTQATLDAVADAIRAAGGAAETAVVETAVVETAVVETAVVDALDEVAVDAYTAGSSTRRAAWISRST